MAKSEGGWSSRDIGGKWNPGFKNSKVTNRIQMGRMAKAGELGRQMISVKNGNQRLRNQRWQTALDWVKWQGVGASMRVMKGTA